MDAVVIGNGIVALTTAFRLAVRAGPADRVVIVGQRDRPGSATLAAAAMLNSFAEIEAPGLASELDLYRFELSHLATRMWPRFVTDILRAAGGRLPEGCSRCEGLCGGCFDRGTWLVEVPDLDRENFDAILAAARELGEPHQLASPDDVPYYAPAERYEAARALFFPNEGWLNPRLAVGALEAALSAFPQVQVVDGAAQRLLQGNGGLRAVELDGGRTLSGDRYLLATGATATDLLARSGLGLPVQRVFYGVGVSVELKSPDVPLRRCVRTPNRGPSRGVYAVPWFVGPDQPHDHVIIGASNVVSPAPPSEDARPTAELLVRAAQEQLHGDFGRAELVRVNVGFRPVSQDTWPLFGPTSIPNLFLATGTRRDGFHLAPLLSDVLTSMLHGEAVNERLGVFAPERKPIRALTRAQAIDKAVRHGLGARDELERLHDAVGASDWGIPPELLGVYRSGDARA